MMNERLLQFLWQFQYFSRNDLKTISGDPLHIFFAGRLNTNQGPDFSDARIRIGSTVWAGHVELHLRTSDWLRHAHTGDRHYKNVILHVVWEHDSVINNIPVFELQSRVPGLLLDRYRELMKTTSFIPCGQSINTVKSLTWQNWKERLVAIRYQRKASFIMHLLEKYQYHWEEVFWILICRNFGGRNNAEAFEAVARSLPLTILGKHKPDVHQLEALLFGQAGLLEGKFHEQYPGSLQKEYQFLQHKYQLEPTRIPLHFLRMRPVNFPTIRLAQLAMLIHQSSHLFSLVRECEQVAELSRHFDVAASDYWLHHYRFDEPSSACKKKMGRAMVENLVINTMIPMLYCYGHYHGEEKPGMKALSWLEQLDPEKNKIVDGFSTLGITSENAADSQALLELKQEYCDARRCLDCAVGNAILRLPGG